MANGNDLNSALQEAGPIVKPMLEMSPEEAQAVYGSGGAMAPDVIGANLLWKFGIKPFADWVMTPGKYVSGAMSPAEGVRPVTDFAAQMLGYGQMLPSRMLMLPEGGNALYSFPIWHGTHQAR